MVVGAGWACGWAAAAAELPGAGNDAGKTVVYRDTWGVPHIYAPTIEAGFYAMGWAQAEDRPELLLMNLLGALGERARVEGPGAVREDLVVRAFDHYGVAQRRADRIRPEVRSQVQAFVRGINDYYRAHPGDVPAWWGDRQVDEFMIIAFARLFLYSWSIDDAFDDLKRGGVEPGFDPPQHASNEWAVAPSRSAAGAAILLIDPHLSWWGPSRFWEFRIHAGELHGSGFTLAGFPCIGLGHNENVAWAMTTGGPDTADVYVLTLDPSDPTKYRYDGEWRQMTSREVVIEVKGAEPQRHTLWASHHGPIIAIRGGKAYAAKTSYADEVQVAEAWYAFNLAKDYRGIVAGLDTLQLFPQNVMAADTSGNIYYQRTGRVPKRPGDYDWTRPVDGSTSAAEWQGVHPASHHVQILNPPQGYMQNCNIAPMAMMVDCPLKLDDVPLYLVGNKGYGTNPRGARAVELLSRDDSVTVEEALAYAVDMHPYGVERWLEVLRQADAKFGMPHRSNPDYVAGIEDLLAWNRVQDRASSGALKYYYWRLQLVKAHKAGPLAQTASRIDDLQAALGKAPRPLDLSDKELEAAAAAVAPAMAQLKADHGSLSGVFGDKFRVGRDRVSWPLGGGSLSEVGMATLRSVGFGAERPDHTRWGGSGQTSTQIVVLTKPIQSWTGPPIGQSDRSDSPHYRDQAEKVFSPARLKPTWWLPQDLAGHIESRTVLEPAL
jgi:acyl-homoserine lactone acylase PvdQ